MPDLGPANCQATHAARPCFEGLLLLAEDQHLARRTPADLLYRESAFVKALEASPAMPTADELLVQVLHAEGSREGWEDLRHVPTGDPRSFHIVTATVRQNATSG